MFFSDGSDPGLFPCDYDASGSSSGRADATLELPAPALRYTSDSYDYAFGVYELPGLPVGRILHGSHNFALFSGTSVVNVATFGESISPSCDYDPRTGPACGCFPVPKAFFDGNGVGEVCDTACIDLDGDGYGGPGSAACPNGDAPDCNDRRADINPGATEVCNHYDDDCDGLGNEGFPDCNLAVVLDGFTAEVGKDGVTLRWRTLSETAHYGFRVLRSTDGGVTVQPLGGIIPARGSETEGADYEYLDAVGRMSGTVSYWLEDLDLEGNATRHGPVTVTLQPFRERSGDGRDDRGRRGP